MGMRLSQILLQSVLIYLSKVLAKNSIFKLTGSHLTFSDQKATAPVSASWTILLNRLLMQAFLAGAPAVTLALSCRYCLSLQYEAGHLQCNFLPRTDFTLSLQCQKFCNVIFI